MKQEVSKPFDEQVFFKESEIKDFCSKSLANFKVPEKINFTDKLPRTATGKIQRRIVAKHFNN